MADRSPDLIAAAIHLLPPLPDASVVLISEHGEELFKEMDVYKDILSYGRVIGPEEEAAAVKKVGTEEAAAAVKKVEPEEAATAAVKKGRWELAWRSLPLVIHDTGLVGAIEDLDPDLGDVAASVSTAAITGVLEEHPGPVNCIRIEISECPSPDLVRTWIDLIGAKERGGRRLRELVLVNQSRPTDEAFQLNLLPGGPGGLRSLSLCFFALTPLDADHLSPCLAELRLMGCDLCWQALSALLPELRALQLLVLGCCNITRGCGPEGFRVVSCSLTHFEMALCTASGAIRIEYAPKLATFLTGVRPLPLLGKAGRLRLDLRTPGALRELQDLTLLRHDLTFISTSSTWVRIRFRLLVYCPARCPS
jgi:hypothetical protein